MVEFQMSGMSDFRPIVLGVIWEHNMTMMPAMTANPAATAGAPPAPQVRKFPMIYVIATIEVVGGRHDDFLAEFRKIVPHVREENGCIEYGPTVDVKTNIKAQGGARENVVTIVEKWESLAALEAHLVAPHMVEYRPKVKEMVKRVSLQILEPV
jgi:quinol monooxygenase YgiN